MTSSIGGVAVAQVDEVAGQQVVAAHHQEGEAVQEVDPIEHDGLLLGVVGQVLPEVVRVLGSVQVGFKDGG